MRPGLALAALLAALASPAAAQGAVVARHTAVGVEAFGSTTPGRERSGTYGAGLSAVFGRVGVAGAYGTDGGDLRSLSGGVEFYLTRQGMAEKPATLTIGVALTRADFGTRDAVLFTPAVTLARRVLDERTTALVPQAAVGFAIPVGGEAQLDPQVNASLGVTLGLGDEAVRVAITPSVTYVPEAPDGGSPFAPGVSFGLVFGFD